LSAIGSATPVFAGAPLAGLRLLAVLGQDARARSACITSETAAAVLDQTNTNRSVPWPAGTLPVRRLPSSARLYCLCGLTSRIHVATPGWPALSRRLSRGVTFVTTTPLHRQKRQLQLSRQIGISGFFPAPRPSALCAVGFRRSPHKPVFARDFLCDAFPALLKVRVLSRHAHHVNLLFFLGRLRAKSGLKPWPRLSIFLCRFEGPQVSHVPNFDASLWRRESACTGSGSMAPSCDCFKWKKNVGRFRSHSVDSHAPHACHARSLPSFKSRAPPLGRPQSWALEWGKGPCRRTARRETRTCFDADDFTIPIHQPPAGVAGIDKRIGLNEFGQGWGPAAIIAMNGLGRSRRSRMPTASRGKRKLNGCAKARTGFFSRLSVLWSSPGQAGKPAATDFESPPGSVMGSAPPIPNLPQNARSFQRNSNIRGLHRQSRDVVSRYSHPRRINEFPLPRPVAPRRGPWPSPVDCLSKAKMAQRTAWISIPDHAGICVCCLAR